MSTAAPIHDTQRPATLATWSEQAWQRLQLPPQRGSFRPLDAARRQLGLVATADDMGQCRITWLIDVEQQVVEDARFLAFGALSSHPLADAFCQRAKGQSIDAICSLDPLNCEADLRDTPETPAFGEDPTLLVAFIRDLQQRIAALAPTVTVLPKPVEVERYQRKREQEWDDQDRAWLPLSLMKKLMQVQKVGDAILLERSNRPITWSVEGLHDDFLIKASFTDVSSDETPTLIAFLQEGLQERIHPQISVEEVSS
ncbi:MAG: hypothetical protein EA401_05115 [Planctomycetota bacterium]|nr:MAG: hypothetical protein EA401_05115 [Planctomycetota bacterium]